MGVDGARRAVLGTGNEAETALVIEAAHRPLRFVVVGGMRTEVDDAASVQVVVDHVQEHFVAEASVTGDSVDDERRIEGEGLGIGECSWIFLPGIGWQEIVE